MSNPASPEPAAMSNPAPPERAAADISMLSDWDWVPFKVYVVLPNMLREEFTLNRDVTVGKVKEMIEFINPQYRVRDQHLWHSRIDGFKPLTDNTMTLSDAGLGGYDTLVLYTRKVWAAVQTDPPSTHRATQTLFTAYEDPSESASSASTHGASIPLALREM
jgi:hypothetical protein